MTPNTNTNEDQEAASAGCHDATCSRSSDTPETDAQTYWNRLPLLATSAQIVYADLARKLERERNVARKLAFELGHQLLHVCSATAMSNGEDYARTIIDKHPEIFQANAEHTHPPKD